MCRRAHAPSTWLAAARWTVAFGFYEEAMKDSESELINNDIEKMGALVDAPPSFRNLDVVSVMDDPA